LRKLAAVHMAEENRVTPSTLVHEAYLRPHHRLSQLGLCPGLAARRPRARALKFFVGQIGPRLRLVGQSPSR
jgi:hypothetical protein